MFIRRGKDVADPECPHADGGDSCVFHYGGSLGRANAPETNVLTSAHPKEGVSVRTSFRVPRTRYLAVSLATTALAITTVVFSATSASASTSPSSAPAATNSQPVVVPPGSDVTWGETTAGKSFSYIVTPGQSLTTTQSGDVAAAAVVCTLSVGNPYLAGSDMNGVSTQTCTGDFGIMYTFGQFWRSSYRGWVGYSSGWTESEAVINPTLQITWFNYCHSGQGQYNYGLAAQGYSSAAGYSIKVLSSVQPTWNCGPSAAPPSYTVDIP
jgi:hypothetical protein